MFRRIAALILSAVLLAAFTGCAANNAASPADTDSENDRQAALVNPLVITDESGTEL